MIAYEKEIQVNSTKVVKSLSRNNLSCHESTTGSLVHNGENKE